MQDSQTPTKIQLPWGASAGGSYIRTVPVPSQIGSQNGAASFTDGFPPNCFIPLATGGAGPFGSDMNGVLNQITGATRWSQAGGPYFYDSVFSTAIGGYPKGAMLANAATAGLFWISTVENNTSNPDAAGANWLSFGIPIYLNTQVDGVLPMANSNVRLLGAYTGAGVSTFTVPADTHNCFGYCTAGGGSGAGSNNPTNSGGGGGAGGTAFGWFSVTPAGTITMTVGAGGYVGTGAPVGSNGIAGASSSIGSIMSASGGGAGTCTTNAAGGAGGVGTGGTVNLWGGGGNDGDYCTNGTTGTGPGGLGGASIWGGGTRASTVSGAGGFSANGSGGGGGYFTAGKGAAGADGMILIFG